MHLEKCSTKNTCEKAVMRFERDTRAYEDEIQKIEAEIRDAEKDPESTNLTMRYLKDRLSESQMALLDVKQCLAEYKKRLEEFGDE